MILLPGEAEADQANRFNSIVALAARVCGTAQAAAVIISEETATLPHATAGAEPACRSFTVLVRNEIPNSQRSDRGNVASLLRTSQKELQPRELCNYFLAGDLTTIVTIAIDVPPLPSLIVYWN